MQYTLLATTVGRTGERTWARGTEDQGYLMGLLVDTDCETLDVQFQTRLPNLKVSPILRFGGKGIALWDDEIAVAAYDNICRYDRASGQLMKQFSHRLFGDLHSTVVEAGRLYVTAPLANALLAFDREMRLEWSYFGHDDDDLCRRVRVPDDVRNRAQQFASLGTDYRFYTEKDLDLFHFNHHFFVNGDLVVNIPPAGRMWNVSKREWFLDEFNLGPGADGAFHDGVYLADQGLYVNHTQEGTVNKHDPHTGRLVASIPTVPNNDWTEHHTIGWLRGLCHLDDERFLVGQAGPSLMLVDFADGRAVREWPLGTDLKHTFFALYETTRVAQSPAGLRVAVLEQ